MRTLTLGDLRGGGLKKVTQNEQKEVVTQGIGSILVTFLRLQYLSAWGDYDYEKRPCDCEKHCFWVIYCMH